MSPTPHRDEEISSLRARIAELDSELAVARLALRSLEATTTAEQDASATRPEPSAYGVVTAASSSEEKISLFRKRFAGRQDVYATRWSSDRTGKTGWSPAVRGGFYTDTVTDADLLALDDSVIERHLRGGNGFHAGLYPMFPDDRCRVLVCDFDDGEWRLDAAAYVEACRIKGVPALAEISRSGDGAHVWIFFEEAVAAAAARVLGTRLLRAAMTRRPSASFSSYDRFFPSQDTLPRRSPGRLRLGNLIALPLQGDCRRHGTTVFADPDTWEPFDDQFAALSSVAVVTEEELNNFVSETAQGRIGPDEQLTRRPRRAEIRATAKHAAGREVELLRDATLHVPVENLPGEIITELKHMASIANPEFYRKQAQRFSTYGTPRFVTSFEHDDTEIRLPRGLLDQTRAVLADAGFRVRARIDTRSLPPINVRFIGQLHAEQQRSLDAIRPHDTGVLVAPPGSGKTVIACALIADRATPTAILVNRAELLEQWRVRLEQFLALSNHQVGQLGNGRRKRRGVVDLIMMQSLAHRHADPTLLSEYGQVIVDECHAIAAPSIEAALRRVNVPYWVGLTATPYRADQLGGLITMQCGPIRHTTLRTEPVPRQLIIHTTTFTTNEPGTDGPSIQAIYTELAANRERNALIADLVGQAARDGRTCLVLTNRVDHLHELASMIGERCDTRVFELHGRLAPANRRQIRAELAALDDAGGQFVLVAIDKIAGEGLDLPALNTLFLAVPVSFKGRVIQQIGRITRGQHDTTATVHDFRDHEVPLLERMHQRRRRTIIKEGFQPTDPPTSQAPLPS